MPRSDSDFQFSSAGPGAPSRTSARPLRRAAARSPTGLVARKSSTLASPRTARLGPAAVRSQATLPLKLVCAFWMSSWANASR